MCFLILSIFNKILLENEEAQKSIIVILKKIKSKEVLFSPLRKFGCFISYRFTYWIFTISYTSLSSARNRSLTFFFSLSYGVRQINFPLALNMRDKFPINSEFRFHEGWAWKLFQAQWQQHNWKFFLFTDLVLAQLKAPRAPEMVMHKFGHLNVFPYIPTAFSQRRASFHLIWTELLWIKLFCFQSRAFVACQMQWVSAGIFFSSDTPLITFQLVLLFIHQLCWLWTSPYCHWGEKKQYTAALIPFLFI